MLASALLSNGRIFDDNAETIPEMAAKNNTSVESIRRAIKKNGERLEKVWRMVNGRPIPAYRVKQ